MVAINGLRLIVGEFLCHTEWEVYTFVYLKEGSVLLSNSPFLELSYM